MMIYAGGELARFQMQDYSLTWKYGYFSYLYEKRCMGRRGGFYALIGVPEQSLQHLVSSVDS